MYPPLPIRTRIRSVARIYLPIALILVLAVAMRIGYLASYGDSDLIVWARWIGIIQHSGLFSYYAQHDPANAYPPLAMLSFGLTTLISGPVALNRRDPALWTAIKLTPTIFELATIVVCAWWLRGKPILRWLVPGLLAISYGPLLVSAWWGQIDSQFTLFVVLALIALNRQRPLWAWAFLSLGLLMKPQAAVLIPLLVILTWRRDGLRTLVRGIAIASLIAALIFAPFVAGSGLDNTLSAYTKALDVYPAATVNAFNLWYVLTPHNRAVLPWPDDAVTDAQPAIGPITDRQIGVVLFAAYILLICVLAWRQADQPREFVLAAALYLGAFNFPTQVHERYLYAGAILLIIAIAQDWRLWIAALITMYTFAYNIMLVAPVYTDFQWGPQVAGWIALLNVIVMLYSTAVGWSSSGYG